MVDFTQGSTVNRLVTGGTFGDFKWPYNVPDSPFGPWSPMCKSDILDPTAPCQPYVPGKPCNFKELAWMLSEVLQAVVTLCPDTPPADSNGDPEWVDPRLVAIHNWLDFNWVQCFNDLNDTLKRSVKHYVFVILKEAIMRRTCVYFGNYVELQSALTSIHDTFDGCSWTKLDERITQVTEIILTHGGNKPLMSMYLEVQVTNTLDVSWVKVNNTSLKIKKDYSLLTVETLVKLNLTISETLKRYTATQETLQFEIITKECNGSFLYNLRYGNGKFNIRNTSDFLNVAKSVFGT